MKIGTKKNKSIEGKPSSFKRRRIHYAVLLALGPTMAIQAGAQSFTNYDGSKTNDLNAAVATWVGNPEFRYTPLPLFQSSPVQGDWGLEAMNVQYAYARGYSGKGVKLGSVDSGLLMSHEEFAKRGNVTAITISGTYLKGLSTDVELKSSSQQVAPTAGAVSLLKFETAVGRTALLLVKQADGAPLPFGASVFDETGQEIGSVGQGSKLVVRGLQDKGQLTVKWGAEATTSCRIAYELPVRDEGKTKSEGYQQVNAICAPTSNSTGATPVAKNQKPINAGGNMQPASKAALLPISQDARLGSVN